MGRKCEHCGQELPQPPSLREQVQAAFREAYRSGYRQGLGPIDCDRLIADAVLAVVADWLAAQPLPPVGGNYRPAYVDQRDHDVRLLRGGSDG